MASTKGVPQIQRKSGGDAWHSHTYYEDMNSTELKAYQDGINNYNAMLKRQEAHMEKRWADLAAQQSQPTAERIGCVFAKCSNLPNQVINYNEPNGFVPVDSLGDYGNFVILGGREADSSGLVPLEKISGSVPAGLGALALGGLAFGTAPVAAAGITTVVVVSTVVGLVALLWSPETADDALYTEDQLRSLKQARSRVRLHVEQRADGSLKGYGFYTGKNPEWEMIDVVQFTPRGSQQVADFGDGVELIWTPAVDPKDTLGIPALQGAPHIWVYPPTPMADSIIVDPIYPPDYKDFILVFPAGSGIPPLYVVLNTQLEKNKAAGAAYEDKVYEGFAEEMEESAQQITVKTQSGTRTRRDMIGRNADGEISCVECKASPSAPLTKNQRLGYPEVEESGAIIVGKGKPGFPGGTAIPPTRVDISRPNPTN